MSFRVTRQVSITGFSEGEEVAGQLITHYAVKLLTVGAFFTIFVVACLRQRQRGLGWPDMLKVVGALVLLLVLLVDTLLFDTFFGLREVDLSRVPSWYQIVMQVGPLGWCLIALAEVLEYVKLGRRSRDSE